MKLINLYEFVEVIMQAVDSQDEEAANQLVHSGGWDNKKYDSQVNSIIEPNITAFEVLAEAEIVFSKMEVLSSDMKNLLSTAGFLRHHFNYIMSDEPKVDIGLGFDFHDRSLDSWLQTLETTLDKYREEVSQIPAISFIKVKCYEQIKPDGVYSYGNTDDYIGMNYKNNLKYLGVYAIIELRHYTRYRKGEERHYSNFVIVKLPNVIKDKKAGSYSLYTYYNKVVLTKPIKLYDGD